MSPAASPTLVAAVDIKVGGQALDPSITERLLEARVQDNLMLPDAFLLRLRDPDFELVDGTRFEVGASIELRFAAVGASSPQDGFTGEVATIAPQFEGEGCVLVVRGYDVSHRLNRSRKTRTFQDMTASDIASKVIGESGLPAEVEPTSEVYPFEQQSNETDWSYLWRLALRVSYELVCAEGKIHFRAPGTAAGQPVKLEWGKELRAFHPRATAAAQVEQVTVSGWDPKSKRRVTANATSAKLDSSIGMERDEVVQDLGGGAIAVADRIVTSQGEADALAQSTLDRLANAWLEAEGISQGDPKIRAGAKVRIAGVGRRFGGDYLVTRSTHLMRGERSYETQFEISGRSRRTLLDMLTPSPRRDYSDGLVIGVVTNNDDPEKMGRVRVKFPGLDERQEGWWARVAGVAASGKRGVMMMPLVDDEVVVGFEHGDARRPFVLGSLWNGAGKPEGLAAEGGGKPDGSFRLRSDEKATLESGGDMSLRTEAKMNVESGSELSMQAGGPLAIEGDGNEVSITCGGGSVVIDQGGRITIKGTDVAVEGSGKLALTSSGIVQVRGSQVMLG